jgi:hypothetical protein
VRGNFVAIEPEPFSDGFWFVGFVGWKKLNEHVYTEILVLPIPSCDHWNLLLDVEL